MQETVHSELGSAKGYGRFELKILCKDLQVGIDNFRINKASGVVVKRSFIVRVAYQNA